MYILFEFPEEATTASHLNRYLVQQLHEWSDQYNIPYNTKTVKWNRRVTFDNDETYSFFAMTWTGPEYRLVDPMKIDRN